MDSSDDDIPLARSVLSSSEEDNIPLARFKSNLGANTSQTLADHQLTNNDEIEESDESDYVPMCDVRMCKRVARIECEDCSMFLCTFHDDKNYSCASNHFVKKKQKRTKGTKEKLKLITHLPCNT